MISFYVRGKLPTPKYGLWITESLSHQLCMPPDSYRKQNTVLLYSNNGGMRKGATTIQIFCLLSSTCIGTVRFRSYVLVGVTRNLHTLKHLSLRISFTARFEDGPGVCPLRRLFTNRCACGFGLVWHHHGHHRQSHRDKGNRHLYRRETYPTVRRHERVPTICSCDVRPFACAK